MQDEDEVEIINKVKLDDMGNYDEGNIKGNK